MIIGNEFERFISRKYTVCPVEKTVMVLAHNCSLISARKMISVAFEKERFNNYNGEFSNYLSKFFLLKAVRN